MLEYFHGTISFLKLVPREIPFCLYEVCLVMKLKTVSTPSLEYLG